MSIFVIVNHLWSLMVYCHLCCFVLWLTAIFRFPFTKGDFLCDQNNSKYRYWTPLRQNIRKKSSLYQVLHSHCQLHSPILSVFMTIKNIPPLNQSQCSEFFLEQLQDVLPSSDNRTRCSQILFSCPQPAMKKYHLC